MRERTHSAVRKRLQEVLVVFEHAGGRGVALAEEIDQLRFELRSLAARKGWRKRKRRRKALRSVVPPGTECRNGVLDEKVNADAAIEQATYTTDPHGERSGFPGWTRVLRRGQVVHHALSEQAARDWIAQLSRSCHFTAGAEARLAGATRELPSYVTDKRGKNARTWLHGYDSTRPAAITQVQG